jgi:hypothetical protein
MAPVKRGFPRIKMPKTEMVRPYIRVKGGVKLVKAYFRARPQKV